MKKNKAGKNKKEEEDFDSLFSEAQEWNKDHRATETKTEPKKAKKKIVILTEEKIKEQMAIAKSLLMLEKIEEAKEIYEVLIDSTRTNHKAKLIALENLAKAYLKTEQFDKAIKYYKDILSIYPESDKNTKKEFEDLYEDSLTNLSKIFGKKDWTQKV